MPARASVGGWACAGAAAQRPQAGQHLLEGERLAEVVVGAEVEAGDPLLTVVLAVSMRIRGGASRTTSSRQTASP